ncbi:hypothetical protein GGF31_008948 [Allomyces arbusculus]|nr:hypothetical protein GGF31_008948 [Allomyces arbusculus]
MASDDPPRSPTTHHDPTMRLISPYHHVASLPPASMPAAHATGADPAALDLDTVATMLASRPDAPAALDTAAHDQHQRPPQSPTFRLEDAVYLSPVDHSKLPPAPWLAAIASTAAAAAASDTAAPAPPPAPPQDATAGAYAMDPAGFAALLGQWSPTAVDVVDATLATLDPMATFMTTTTTTTTTMATHDAPPVTVFSLPDPASSAPMPLPMITEAVVATSPASTPVPTDPSPPAVPASSSSPAPTASRRPSTTTDGSPVLSAVPRRLSVAAATDAPAALPLPPARRASSSEIEHHLDERLLHVDFNDVTVTELKDHLRQRGKPATGKKAVLVARIKAEIAAVLAKRAARAPAGSAEAESLAADAERAAEDAKRAEDQVGAAAVAGIKPPRPDPPQPLPQPLPQTQVAMPMQMHAVQYAQQPQQPYHFPGAPAPLVPAGTAILPAGVMPGSMSPGIACMSPCLPTGAATTGMSPSLATTALMQSVPGSPGVPAPGIWGGGGPAASGLPSPRFQPYPLARPRTNSVQYATSPLVAGGAPSPPVGRLRTNSISYASAAPTTLPQPPRNRSASVSTMVAGMSLDAAAAVAAAAAWNEHAAAAAAAGVMLPDGMMYTMAPPLPPQADAPVPDVGMQRAAVAAAGLATLGHALGAVQQPVSTMAMAPGAPSSMMGGGYVPGPAPGTL